jgi:hypothetical protein
MNIPRLLIFSAFLLLPLLGGCAHNYYNMPQDVVARQVRVLGVLPIMVDNGSDIRHPQKDELSLMLANTNRSFERDLVRLIKNNNSFYAVTMLDEDPRPAFSNLVARREQRDDAAIQYNKYFWKGSELQQLTRKHSVDAVMLVVISGVTRTDKISACYGTDTLEADYNYLIMTAQLVDPTGSVLWEYPNFRKPSLYYNPLVNLQYPDFDEAKANMETTVQIKFKSLDGLRRALEKRRLDLFRRETAELELYMPHFEEIAAMLEIDKDNRPDFSQSIPDAN